MAARKVILKQLLLASCALALLSWLNILRWPRFMPKAAYPLKTPIALSEPPTQTTEELPGPFTIRRGGIPFYLKPVAKYLLRGQVVSRNRHFLGWDALLMPMDLAVVWGPLARPEVQKQFDFRSSNRFGYISTDQSDVLTEELLENFSNNHFIPADDRMESVIWNVDPGDAVELSGYLVDIEGPMGMEMQSSRVRTDLGPGACEIIYLTGARVGNKRY